MSFLVKIADAGDSSFCRPMFSRGLEFYAFSWNCSAIYDSQTLLDPIESA